MDIDLLSKMVKELILDNDKVVLPGLGAFVAEMVPSTFSDKGYTINPPYRRLYFRSKPDEGDALVRFYASSNGLDFYVADRAVRDFISELKSILFTRKTVIFPGLGRMRATKENAVFFVADEDLDIFPDGLGLEPISLKTHQETKEEVEAAIVELKAIVEDKADVELPADNTLDSVTAAVHTKAETETATEAEGETATEITTETEIVTVTETEVVTEPVAENVKGTATVKNTSGRKLVKMILWVICLFVAFLAVYVAVARLCPGILDSILYTPEELDILNR